MTIAELFAKLRPRRKIPPSSGPLRDMLSATIAANEAAEARGVAAASIPIEERRRMYEEWYTSAPELSFGLIYRKRAELGLSDDD